MTMEHLYTHNPITGRVEFTFEYKVTNIKKILNCDDDLFSQ